jgi:hypothetical protein
MNTTEHPKYYPQTLLSCWALIKRLDRELTELRAKENTYGVASELLRNPENFQKIDDVLEKLSSRPFTFSELYEEWIDLTGIDAEMSKKVLSDLRKHFRDLLTKNGFIRKSGSAGRNALYRVQSTYNYTLRTTSELAWRASGQDEGTYLMPKA